MTSIQRAEAGDVTMSWNMQDCPKEFLDFNANSVENTTHCVGGTEDHSLANLYPRLLFPKCHLYKLWGEGNDLAQATFIRESNVLAVLP